jgi:hypothetical protein
VGEAAPGRQPGLREGLEQCSGGGPGAGKLVCDLEQLTIPELLALSRAVLRELRRRNVIRTGNAPTGDYAELLVRQATGGQLAPSSARSWDVETSTEKLQVKARVVTDPQAVSERQLSSFRSWDFHAGMIVLFDDNFTVWRAARIPAAVHEVAARPDPRVNGYRVFATEKLLDAGDDWTELLAKPH